MAGFEDLLATKKIDDDRFNRMVFVPRKSVRMRSCFVLPDRADVSSAELN
jgi:hypothetical protein